MTDKMEPYRNLLAKIDIIRFRYEKLNDENKFNLFSLLRQEDDEVNLHSAFICEMLNPKGTHGLGSAFLKHFLDTVGLELPNSDGAIVKKEFKNIDIYIDLGEDCVVIENKIYAEDQTKQIERYYDICKELGKEPLVVYLTLEGEKPSDSSLGKYKDEDGFLFCASYHDDILEWLSKCIAEVSLKPLLRESLVQYLNLIKHLTGQSSSQEQLMELKDLLLEGKNIQLAHNVVQGWDQLKEELQLNFWKDLESEIKNRGHISLNIQKYTKSKISKYVNTSRNNRFYGIMYSIKKVNDQDDLCVQIEIDHNIYYGLTVLSNNKTRDNNLDSSYDSIHSQIKTAHPTSYARNQWWLSWKFPEKRLNFMEFSSENVFSLADTKKRQEYVMELVDEIEDFVANCKIK